MMEKKAPMSMMEKCALSEYQSGFEKMAESVKEKLGAKSNNPPSPSNAPIVQASSYYKQPSFDFMKDKGKGK
jgi:hypothetical protein